MEFIINNIIIIINIPIYADIINSVPFSSCLKGSFTIISINVYPYPIIVIIIGMYLDNIGYVKTENRYYVKWKAIL